MCKKRILIISLIFSLVMLSSCWIYPGYKEYEIIDGIYYFQDYETMKSVIIPMINKSFSNWHWSSEEFNQKYEKYFSNIAANTDDYTVLSSKNYAYAVRNKKSASNVQTTEGKTVRAEFYWITTKDNKAVIFYQN